MRHTVSSIDLDITFGGLPFERSAVEGGALHAVGKLVVRLPRVEDLLVMKAVARRPKDAPRRLDLGDRRRDWIRLPAR